MANLSNGNPPGPAADALRTPPAAALDVRELQARLEEAHAAVARYRELFEFAPDAYLATDRSGNIEQANQAATALFNARRDVLVRTPLPFYIAPEDRAGFCRRLAHVTRSGRSEGDWEVRLHHCTGPEVWVALSVSPLTDSQGQLVGLLWLVRGVSARRRFADALRAEKELIETLLDAAQAIVLVVDENGRLLRANAQVEAVTGYARAELLPTGWQTVMFPPEVQPEIQRWLLNGLSSQAERAETVPLRTRKGETRLLRWQVRPVTLADNLSALLVVGHDITELEQAQQRALQNERLAAIGQMAAGLAHESRNAIQRSQACLERLGWMLENQPAALDLVRRAQKAQEDLLRNYEDVREYAVPVRPELTTCDLASVWRAAWADSLAPAQSSNARLDELVDGEAVCIGDRYRLGQVFRNLFENALAACSGPVRVSVSCRAVNVNGCAMLRISVRDNGPGLTEEQRRRVFEPFFSTKVRGTGLGMAIAKRIVEKHGGTIEVAESATSGADFVIHLPRSQP